MKKPKDPFTAEESMRARVITCGVSKATLGKFTDAELLAIDWFAAVPELFTRSSGTPPDELQVLSPFNYHCLAFWDAYRRWPEGVLKIASALRLRNWIACEAFKVGMKMLLNERPQLTDPELTKELSLLLNRNNLDVSTVKKARQRLLKAAKATGTK